MALLALGWLYCGNREFSAHAQTTSSLPQVHLSADSLAPRPIEQRTGEAVTHDYAQSWQDLAKSLDANRTDLLSDYFVGEAKRQITQRIADQKQGGLRTQYVDHGHHVKAVFYAQDGGEMQLEDLVDLETKVFDGNTLIYSGRSHENFLVLMTPGADRWYVRSLQSVPENAF
jgi:hypothetical protein